MTVGSGETLGSLEGWPLLTGIFDTFGVLVGGVLDASVRFALGNDVKDMNEIG